VQVGQGTASGERSIHEVQEPREEREENAARHCRDVNDDFRVGLELSGVGDKVARVLGGYSLVLGGEEVDRARPNLAAASHESLNPLPIRSYGI
jgi:hypothetical protein